MIPKASVFYHRGFFNKHQEAAVVYIFLDQANQQKSWPS